MLSADAGTVTVDFTNNDLFWHTFTVPALGVDIRAPVKGQRRVSFHAASGAYEFFCAIPGHKQIGMRGPRHPLTRPTDEFGRAR